MKGTNPFLFKLFLLAIIIPGLVLSVLSFLSINNEALLAEKRYDENLKAFQRELNQRIDSELNRLIEQIRKSSGFLFDQPRTISELKKNLPLESVRGVESLFLFHNTNRYYPFLVGSPSGKFFSDLPSPEEREIVQRGQKNRLWELRIRRIRAMNPSLPLEERLKNYLGILRIYNSSGNTLQSLEVIQILLSNQFQNIIQPSQRSYLVLNWFENLNQLGQKRKAINFALRSLNDFYSKPQLFDLNAMEFAYETIFNTILSYEEITHAEREAFWNLKNNLESHLKDSRLYEDNRDILLHLLQFETKDSRGMSYLVRNDKIYFKMSHPALPGNQNVLGIFSTSQFEERFLARLRPLLREWKSIPFRLQNSKGKILLHQHDQDTLKTLQQSAVLEGFPNWNLTIYQRDISEIRKESRHKITLLYSLIGSSLLILFLGSFFMLRGLSQERNLLSMKANFLSSVSHELKTPLTSIRMFAEMLEKGRMRKPEKISEYAGHITKEASRLDQMIQSVLSFTRMEHSSASFKMEKIDLVQCLKQALSNHEKIAEQKGVKLISSYCAEAPWTGDYGAITSLMQNLIDNAVKYTPEYGKVQVRLEALNRGWVFEVEDSGVGIPPEEIKHIFDDFYRVGDEMTRTTKGSGLGLAIVKRVANAHQATIQVDSTPGEGSIFKVRFKKRKDDDA